MDHAAMPATDDSISRLVAGAMTGTSLDGIDVALVRIDGRALAMTVAFEGHASAPFPESLGTRLRAAAEQQAMTAGEFARLAREFGEFHARVLAEFVGGRTLDLAAVHGQTIFHAPPDSWQLVDATPIVAALRCPVVADLRRADLADGGGGAPMTPIADWVLFRDRWPRAIVNLGGFCNATLLPPDQGDAPDGDGPPGPAGVRGMDICACNQVLDAVARIALGRPYDESGRAASVGTVHAEACAELTSMLAAQRRARRSLGTGDELVSWVASRSPLLAPEDLAATAATAVAAAIGDALAAEGATVATELLVAGGGARHVPLVGALGARFERGARPLHEVRPRGCGPPIPIDAREAAEMAIIGALAADGVRIGLRAVTGRERDRVLDGCWWRPQPRAS
jgi:anhydro-N-acetylmuramic acid kinase